MSAAKRRDKTPTITKKELIDRIAAQTRARRTVVKQVVQEFLDAIIEALSQGHRLEFRDFGVFETRLRRPRQAHNPKTLATVAVPSKRTVKFKIGRVMRQRIAETVVAEVTPLATDGASKAGGDEALTKSVRGSVLRSPGPAVAESSVGRRLANAPSHSLPKTRHEEPRSPAPANVGLAPQVEVDDQRSNGHASEAVADLAAHKPRS